MESAGDRTPESSRSSDLEAFIIVHDERTLLEHERGRTFRSLPQHRYLFVGMGSTELLRGRDDVIVARSLPDNIELQPNLLAFTAWYAIARNGLATKGHIALLEYDVRVSDEFHGRTLSALGEARRIVGYVPFPLTHPMYLHATPWLTRSLNTVYGLDPPRLIGDHLAGGGADLWTSTTNAAMGIEDLAAFVDWFLPLTALFSHDPIGAHVHERTIPLFCLLNEIENLYIPGVLEHEQARSHGILAVSQEQARRRAESDPPLRRPTDS